MPYNQPKQTAHFFLVCINFPQQRKHKGVSVINHNWVGFKADYALCARPVKRHKSTLEVTNH